MKTADKKMHHKNEKGKRTAKSRLTQSEEDQMRRILVRFGRLSEDRKDQALAAAKAILEGNS